MIVRKLVHWAVAGPGGVARLAGAFLLLGTVAAQHPNPSFDRVKDKDTFSSLFPNWRFFAPDPARHDYHIAYRSLSEQRVASEWKTIDVIEGRKLRHIVWYPRRRMEKAIFDIASDLVTHLDNGLDALQTYPAYHMLREFVRKQVAVEAGKVAGFQFALVRHTGYDESGDPEVVFVSPYTSMVV